MVFADNRPPECDDCREMNLDAGEEPPCASCRKPAGLSRLNMAAWNAWTLLDAHGRDTDTMGGNPLPLRLEAVDSVCRRDADPDGLRKRILILEEKALEWRREAARRRREREKAEARRRRHA